MMQRAGIQHSDAGVLDEQAVCPICLASPSQNLPFAVTGSCQHTFCIPCLERVLLSTPAGAVSYSENNPDLVDAYAVTPTLGLCPMCRRRIKLFDVKDAETGNLLFPPRPYDPLSSPLAGMEFVSRTGSLRFVFPQGTTNTSDIDADVPPDHRPFLLDGEDDTINPVRLPFDVGTHFHEKSNTFHGVITLSKDDELPIHLRSMDRYDIILQFSSAFRFTQGGAIIKYQRNDVPHPFDGRWKVTWLHDNSEAELKVRGSEWWLGWKYLIDFDTNPRQPQFSWPREFADENGQVIVQQVDYDTIANPSGPAVGDSIVWTTTHPEQNRIRWTRLSIGQTPEYTYSIVGSGRHNLLFTVDTTSARGGNVDRSHFFQATYNQNELWGNTFCQGLKVGLASYHFLPSTSNESGGEPAHSAYISYEHTDTAHWPPLDDGSVVPSRVPFRNIRWDPNQRIFRGSICWLNDFGTRWQSCRQWDYEMKFDSEFLCVVSGQVQSFVGDEDDTEDSGREMSTFGLDLVYVNAAIEDRMEQIFQEQCETPTHLVQRHRAARTVIQRIRSEGASERCIAMLLHICRMAAISIGSSSTRGVMDTTFGLEAIGGQNSETSDDSDNDVEIETNT